MLGSRLQFNQSRSDDWIYIPAEAWRNYNQNQKDPQLQRTQSDIVNGGLGRGNKCREKPVISRIREPENRTEDAINPAVSPAASPAFEQVESSLSNVERFLEAITPSVHAQYLSKVVALIFFFCLWMIFFFYVLWIYCYLEIVGFADYNERVEDLWCGVSTLLHVEWFMGVF